MYLGSLGSRFWEKATSFCCTLSYRSCLIHVWLYITNSDNFNSAVRHSQDTFVWLRVLYRWRGRLRHHRSRKTNGARILAPKEKDRGGSWSRRDFLQRQRRKGFPHRIRRRYICFLMRAHCLLDCVTWITGLVAYSYCFDGDLCKCIAHSYYQLHQLVSVIRTSPNNYSIKSSSWPYTQFPCETSSQIM